MLQNQLWLTSPAKFTRDSHAAKSCATRSLQIHRSERYIVYNYVGPRDSEQSANNPTFKRQNTRVVNISSFLFIIIIIFFFFHLIISGTTQKCLRSLALAPLSLKNPYSVQCYVIYSAFTLFTSTISRTVWKKNHLARVSAKKKTFVKYMHAIDSGEASIRQLIFSPVKF